MSYDTSGQQNAADSGAEQPRQDTSRWQQRWLAELAGAKKASQKWRDAGDEITKIYLGDHGNDDMFSRQPSHLNLFSANVNTMRALLYGQAPSVDVARRHGDADDDAARVAAEMLTRLLEPDAQLSAVVGQALDDRLLVGIGAARVRYAVEFGQIEYPEVPGIAPPRVEEVKKSESATVDYVNWRDLRWSPCRAWGEMRWIAFRACMTRKELKARFGEDFGKTIPLASRKGDDAYSEEARGTEAYGKQAEIWEIWDKTTKTVYWVCEGMAELCDTKPDPLGLEDFFPCPPFMLANVTSAAYSPRADYKLGQDQYRQIDVLTERISLLTSALRVVGVYDAGASGVKRLVSEAAENDLIPVDGWAAFAERGGIKGAVDWLPIENIAAVIQQLTAQRTEIIALLYQATGMSDIMRGGSAASETATAQSIKARFASVRIQHLQDTFTAFVTGIQRLRAEIMMRHYDDETLVEQSGMERTADAQHLQEALALLRTPAAQWRIEIESSALAQKDMAAMRDEKAAFVQGLAMFLNAALPVTQRYPSSTPAILEMLKWTMTGFSGSRTIEGVLDRAIASMQQQPPQQQPPDPAQAKMAAEAAKMKATAENDMRKIFAQSQADMAKIQAESKANIVEQAAQALYERRQDPLGGMKR